MSWRRTLIAALLATTIATLLVAPLAAATTAEPKVEVTLDPRSVTLGDRIAATVVIRLDRGDTRAPEFPDWSRGWGKLSVLAAPAAERTESPAGVEWRQKLELAAFEVGQLDLPAVEIALGAAADEKAPRLATPAGLTIEVRSVLPAEEKEAVPKPAEPPRGLALPNAFWWTAAALTALAVVLGVFAGRRRRSGGAGGAGVALPPLAELERTLAKLIQVDPSAPSAPIDPIVGLRTLSYALRRYLGRSLTLPAVESTTTELAQRLGGGALDRATVQRTVRLLREVDQVKFARRAADAAELSRRVEETRSLAQDAERQIHPPAPTAPSAPEAPSRQSAA